MRHYRGGNITIAVAGNTDWEEVLKLANEWCGKWPAGRAPRPTDEANPKGGKSVTVKDSSTQQHVMQMAAAPSATSPLRLAAELLSVIVGDDSGSRLYWDLVDPGLAESADLSYKSTRKAERISPTSLDARIDGGQSPSHRRHLRRRE